MTCRIASVPPQIKAAVISFSKVFLDFNLWICKNNAVLILESMDPMRMP